MTFENPESVRDAAIQAQLDIQEQNSKELARLYTLHRLLKQIASAKGEYDQLFQLLHALVSDGRISARGLEVRCIQDRFEPSIFLTPLPVSAQLGIDLNETKPGTKLRLEKPIPFKRAVYSLQPYFTLGNKTGMRARLARKPKALEDFYPSISEEWFLPDGNILSAPHPTGFEDEIKKKGPVLLLDQKRFAQIDETALREGIVKALVSLGGQSRLGNITRR